MRTPNLLRNLSRLAILVLAGVLCFNGHHAFAAGEGSGSDWRSTYDAIMLCVNFSILVIFLLKFLKNPLKNFFNNQRQLIADEINRLEKEKEKTEAELHEVEKQVAAGDAHVQTIRKRLAEDGQAIKEKIIEHARAQSEFMLAGARKNINNQFIEARKAFQAELVEIAMSAASEKLINEINDKDHEKLVNQFLYDLAETGH